MQQIHIYVALLFVMLFPSQRSAAQIDARQEARSIFRKYERSTGISFKAVIQMYPAGNAARQIDQVEAAYTLQGGLYYCRMANIEIIHNREANLVIDHDDKVILVGKYHRAQQKSDQEEAAYNLQPLFARMELDSVQYAVTTKGADRQLSISGMSDPRIVKYRLVYDPATYLLRQLLIEMKPEDSTYGNGNIIVDIRYSQYSQVPKPVAFFSGSKYLQIQGKQAVLQPAYRSYRLVNQL